MIPSLVAGELQEAIVEYLSTTFALSDDETRDALLPDTLNEDACDAVGEHEMRARPTTETTEVIVDAARGEGGMGAARTCATTPWSAARVEGADERGLVACADGCKSADLHSASARRRSRPSPWTKAHLPG